MKFKIYCIEEYKRMRGMTAPQVVDLFEKHGVYDFLDLPALQWQSLENTVLDIDEYIESHRRFKSDPSACRPP